MTAPMHSQPGKNNASTTCSPRPEKLIAPNCRSLLENVLALSEKRAKAGGASRFDLDAANGEHLNRIISSPSLYPHAVTLCFWEPANVIKWLVSQYQYNEGGD